jgi:hypothetical protein
VFGTYALVQVLGNVRRAADFADAIVSAGYGRIGISGP